VIRRCGVIVCCLLYIYINAPTDHMKIGRVLWSAGTASTFLVYYIYVYTYMYIYWEASSILYANFLGENHWALFLEKSEWCPSDPEGQACRPCVLAPRGLILIAQFAGFFEVLAFSVAFGGVSYVIFFSVFVFVHCLSEEEIRKHEAISRKFFYGSTQKSTSALIRSYGST
jgi:hypothetical protein